MKEASEAVNLDAMSVRELAEYYRDANPRKMATRYAKNKLNATLHRLDGRIALAGEYELTCDELYNRIPKKERW